jgi:predicted Zn finger-like uncharacterized protein
MIITCPPCGKRYLVEETAIDESGRQVQCISCQHEWFFKPPKEAPKHNQVHLDLIGVKSSIARNDSSWSMGWVCTLSTLVVLLSALYFARYHIVLHLPQSAQIFQMIGLAVAPKQTGIILENVKSSVQIGTGDHQVIITGELLNKSDQVQRVPNLKIIALGDCSAAPFLERTFRKFFKRKNGLCAVAKWSYVPSSARLFPGEKLTFEIESERPLIGAKTINVKF